LKQVSFFGCADRELIEAIEHGNKKAFEELFERYWKKVYQFVFIQTQSTEIAQRVVEDVFISLWKKRAVLATEHLPSFLFAEVTDKLLSYIESAAEKAKFSEQTGKLRVDNVHATALNRKPKLLWNLMTDN
jgi:RNA polymerase sigma-70 factor (ECF subfamily)